MRAILLVLLASCASPEGAFELLTYNVAGLPEGLSGSHPETNHPLIAPKLSAYDLVVVQEDFAYHELLAEGLAHPNRTEAKTPVERPMGDGLAFFARFPLGAVERVQWTECSGVLDSGSDCLAEKGFAVTTVTLADGVSFELYDLHADASGAEGDIEARRRNFEQLAAHVKRRAAGRAVIVAGDTNLRDTRAGDLETLSKFLASTGLTDACRHLSCPTETIDRVMFRSSDALEVTPRSWRFAKEMVDAAGAPLSDHEAVHVGFSWRARE